MATERLPRRGQRISSRQSEHFPEYIGKTPQHFTRGAENFFGAPPIPAPNARPTLCAFVTNYVANGAGRFTSAASGRRFHRYSGCLVISDTRPFVFSP
jgi:hypothetical protein